ncbi:polymorphic toxin-type HINT domain-containing protein [Zavarzinella formosa]|uniref:polymorphic toxin-type HINT domain-containing protein n=1 Tax=Zavarzinella formosa TaxID=360055 RepID=UPI0002F36E1F|nr:polymorphic toxin-type HINT domain-containing protein [Zavarzinella formosa]
MIDLLGAGLGLYQASKACFVAGTPIRGEHGSRPVEEFQVGERVWSRSENDPSGPVELKEIEEVFVRFAPVISLHVGGQVIGTTGEHPFYAEGKGWIAAHDLTPEDRILTEDGRWLNVEEVFDTGEWQTVYNFRVADYHTCFVGDTGRELFLAVSGTTFMTAPAAIGVSHKPCDDFGISEIEKADGFGGTSLAGLVRFLKGMVFKLPQKHVLADDLAIHNACMGVESTQLSAEKTLDSQVFLLSEKSHNSS